MTRVLMHMHACAQLVVMHTHTFSLHTCITTYTHTTTNPYERRVEPFIVHPPQVLPPSPHEAMEAGEVPLDGDALRVLRAPTLARSMNRKEIVEEIRRSFIRQGRNFKTTTSCSDHVAYKCDGCALAFAISLCKKKGPQFGTWGLTKKAATQSWKVCPFSTLLVSRAKPHHHPLCIM